MSVTRLRSLLRFPDIVVDVTTTQAGRTEFVVAGFDAGIPFPRYQPREPRE